ncbi:MAG: leucine-rich repeat domain-containing protein [Pseudomonadota bacterium]
MLNKLILYLSLISLTSAVNASGLDCSQVTEIPSTECEALVALYNSTNGDSWMDNSGWLETNTPCSWEGVICSGGHVFGLYLSYNSLTRSIPPELGNLSNLTSLYLSFNSLTDSIPSELGNLSNLRLLSLQHNDLTGSIPPELGNLVNLEYLWLSSNQLGES